MLIAVPEPLGGVLIIGNTLLYANKAILDRKKLKIMPRDKDLKLNSLIPSILSVVSEILIDKQKSFLLHELRLVASPLDKRGMLRSEKLA